MPKLLKIFFAITLIFTTISAVSNDVQANGNDRIVTVELRNFIGNTSQLDIVLRGEYEYDETLFEERLQPHTTYRLKVENSNINIYLGSRKIGEVGNSFVIKPVEYNKATYTTMLLGNGNRHYLGELNFTVQANQHIRPYNKLPLEHYVEGVVPREMPALWNADALKAQAVAARTYYLRSFSREGAIINDTQGHQVYGGIDLSYQKKIEDIVNATKGEYLTYNGAIISAVYSSSNGGHTESNAIWSSAVPYLPAKQDPYDLAANNASAAFKIELEKEQISLLGKDLKAPDKWWSVSRELNSAPAESLKTWLRNNGYANKELKIVSIPKLEISPQRTSGNRIVSGSIWVEFFVKNENGTYVKNADGTIRKHLVKQENIKADQLRAMLGTMNFRSLLVTSFDTPVNVDITRTSGQSRVDTAIEVSKQLYPSGFPVNHAHKTVFITTAADFADALSAGPLAAQYGNAPILLTSSNSLPDAVKQEVQRLNAENVIILGGTTAVTNQVSTSLSNISTVRRVERLSGTNRYETNLEINKRLQDVNGVFVASGSNFADALAAAPIAASQKWAIVLSKTNSIPANSVAFIKDKNKQVNILGGSLAISDNVRNELQAVVGANKVNRLSVPGGNRYDTLANILETFQNDLDLSKVLLSTGRDFPDALTSASLAVNTNSPLVLVGESKNANVEKFLEAHRNTINVVNVLGGKQAVSDSQVNFIADLSKTKYIINGRGFGHGIGMSQFGANEMARQGKTYRDILSFYYPGTNLSKQ
ncbi:cell wall-binding repeat-containing protein [Bacillus alkalisoli]|uniref:cell wall-binding repeat-containing protein n=1 Tax=Bacillus alkalisoli TaxID=2011008 RepID=UPI0018E2161B|nr:cell wall-binding repeat-containing protein [Bacillus alkalisoli]